MKVTRKIETWGDAHHPKILDIIRLLLGAFLFIKGLVFLNHFPFLRELIISTKALSFSPDTITLLIYYVTLVHMIGGFLIFLGLLTRVSALIQIPVVFAAVFFVNILNPYFNSELWLSVLVLALLVLFVVIGSGPLSLDRFLRNIRDNN
jgi:putative oxidoreductase